MAATPVAVAVAVVLDYKNTNESYLAFDCNESFRNFVQSPFWIMAINGLKHNSLDVIYLYFKQCV